MWKIDLIFKHLLSNESIEIVSIAFRECRINSFSKLFQIDRVIHLMGNHKILYAVGYFAVNDDDASVQSGIRFHHETKGEGVLVHFRHGCKHQSRDSVLILLMRF